MENNHVLDSLKESVENELRKIIKKDDMTPTELDNATKAVCLLEKIKMIESGGMSYESNSYYGPYNVNHDVRDTYRYSSRDHFMPRRNDEYGYSGHSIKDRMVARLEDMMGEAKNEYERKIVEEWINRLGAEK